jgi:hypothetical protein
VSVHAVLSPWTAGTLILVSDHDALLFAHCDAALPMHTMGECVSASTTVQYTIHCGVSILLPSIHTVLFGTVSTRQYCPVCALWYTSYMLLW